MALLDRPQQPEDKGDNNPDEKYIGDLTLNQQLEYTTTKRSLEKCSREQLLTFALQHLVFHMRYKNTNNKIIQQWGLNKLPEG